MPQVTMKLFIRETYLSCFSLGAVSYIVSISITEMDCCDLLIVQGKTQNFIFIKCLAIVGKVATGIELPAFCEYSETLA